MAKDKPKDEQKSRPYGNYISADQDETTGMFRGVITESFGKDMPETVLHTCTSLHKDELDALADAVSWCNHRGYQYQMA